MLPFILVSILLTALFPASIISRGESKRDVYTWEFVVRETFSHQGRTTSSNIGSGRCPPTGYANAISINLHPLSFTLDNPTPPWYAVWNQPYACFPFQQTEAYCIKYNYNQSYGGCPYWTCQIGDYGTCFIPPPTPNRALPSICLISFNVTSGSLMLHIQDPWDSKWASGVSGALYLNSESRPHSFLFINRQYIYEYSNTTQDITRVEQKIHESETSLHKTLSHESQYSFPSWIEILDSTLNFLNQSTLLPNTTHCFLCAALSRPLLAATPVPYNINNFSNCPWSTCGKPIPTVPLWNVNADDLTCLFTNSTNSYSSQPISCAINEILPQNFSIPVGFYLWCNQFLFTCLNGICPEPCVLVTLTLQLTLYSESEVKLLLSPIQKRAVFLPILVGVSLSASVAAIATAGGALGHGVATSAQFQKVTGNLRLYYSIP
nr:ERV-BabFcenv provirus ancestral Env polyprotein-like [Dasypus novemcinctus]